jgi:hypothetical protein
LKTRTHCALRTSIQKPEAICGDPARPNRRGDKGRRKSESKFLGWLIQAAVSAPADEPQCR